MQDLTISWQTILRDAITRPGTIHEAYSRFHSYSVGNRLQALFQCSARGIQPGPIATFMRWKELGRYVRKGEKALTLCMPVTCKAKHSARDEQGKEKEQEIAFTRFVYRNQWFVLNQTEGAEYQAEPLPDWDESRALAALAIERTPFDEIDGNIQGFATGRKVAINPVAAMPATTLFHESGIEDVQFIRGDEELKGAATTLRKAHYGMLFPDQGPKRSPGGEYYPAHSTLRQLAASCFSLRPIRPTEMVRSADFHTGRTFVAQTIVFRRGRRHSRAILSASMPDTKAKFIEPMLLLRTEKLPDGPQWLHELKVDGYQALAIKTGGKVLLRSRNDIFPPNKNRTAASNPASSSKDRRSCSSMRGS